MYQSSTSNVGFNISLPLDRPRSLKKYDLVSYSSFDHSNDIGNTTNSSLSGSFLEDKNLTAQLQV
ncbi:hypothetical protein WAH98_22320, partial [Acinetobacter baumannii]